MASHDFYDGNGFFIVIYGGVQGDFSDRRCNEFGGAAEARGVVGLHQIVVDCLGNPDEFDIAAGFSGIAGEFAYEMCIRDRVNSPEVNNVTNLKGEGNYTVLDVEGTGHYVGCNLTVKHYQGSWWGEGNDMFFIDGEEYPSLNGTGTEDYFNHAWGMQRNAFPFFGTIVHEGDTDGFHVSYRFHITDPVRFEKRLRVTIEHGHANHLSDDWSSTAYWYQTLPTAKPLTILPVEEMCIRDRINSALRGGKNERAD